MKSGGAIARDTVPKLLLRNAERYRNLPSMREKDLGIWQTWSWAEMLGEIRSLAIGLTQLGLRRGDRVTIIGGNRPRLYWAQAAVQSIGAIPVPIYQDAAADEMAFVLADAGVKFAIVQGQEHVDKLLLADRVNMITRIIYDEGRGLKKYEDPRLSAFEAIQSSGRAAAAEGPAADAAWSAEVARGRGEDPAAILYTSGATGDPKGVVLSHAALIKGAEIGIAMDNLTHNDEALAYLPLAWVGDHLLCYVQSAVAGYSVSCPESPDTILEDRREISPTYFFAPPRVFESLLTLITVRMQDASALKRGPYDYFMRLARRVGERVLTGQRIGPIDRLLYAVGKVLVYAPIRDRIGFSRLRVAYTAGEAIGPEIFTFYRALGINLKQLYGQTEAGVYVTAQPDGEIFSDTVGRPVPGVEVRIAENGEVLYRSPAQFDGYYNNDAATRAAKSDDGWIRSGDAGSFDARGHLKVADRTNDVGRLRSGSLYLPKHIENKLKFYPSIKEAIAFGHGQDFVTVMLNIELDVVASWAKRNGVSYSSYQELAGNPKVAELLRQHVDEVNGSLAAEAEMAGAQIRRFLVLHKELDADDGELTRTQKVRRHVVAERYAKLVQALYDGSTHGHLVTEVTFEDGRKGEVEAHVAIVDMQPRAARVAAEVA